MKGKKNNSSQSVIDVLKLLQAVPPSRFDVGVGHVAAMAPRSRDEPFQAIASTEDAGTMHAAERAGTLHSTTTIVVMARRESHCIVRQKELPIRESPDMASS